MLGFNRRSDVVETLATLAAGGAHSFTMQALVEQSISFAARVLIRGARKTLIDLKMQ
jgi:hypothetical protein